MNVVAPHSSPATCLTESQFWKVLDEFCEEEHAEHLEQCAECRGKLSTLMEEVDILRSQFGLFGNPHDESARLEIPTGTMVGKYQVLQLISSGGQGTVYRGWDPKLEREVAIKVAAQPLTGTSEARTRLHQEGVLLAQIQHDNLAQVFDYGIHESHPFLVMELLEGTTLCQLVATRELSSAEITSILWQLASALQLCHDEQILHLDIKPENIIVDEDLHVTLVDFGVSWRCVHHERSGQIVAGTLEYMAPEQRSGQMKDWSGRTDIYGLGALMLYLLTGHTPPIDETSAKVHHQKIRKKLETAPATKRLKAICLQALELNPDDRIANAHQFQQLLLAETRFLGRWLITCGLLLIVIGLQFSLRGHPLQNSASIKLIPRSPYQYHQAEMWQKCDASENGIVSLQPLSY